MKIMTYKEFYDSLIFRNRDIIIPSLNITIDKTRFLSDKGYNINEQEKYLKDIYMSNLTNK